MWYEHGILKIINNDGIAFIKKLEANEVGGRLRKGKLKGRLNEIAAGLNEESNPVIMVAKYKNKNFLLIVCFSRLVFIRMFFMKTRT